MPHLNLEDLDIRHVEDLDSEPGAQEADPRNLCVDHDRNDFFRCFGYLLFLCWRFPYPGPGNSDRPS